jgi:hypothetical protein
MYNTDLLDEKPEPGMISNVVVEPIPEVKSAEKSYEEMTLKQLQSVYKFKTGK